MGMTMHELRLPHVRPQKDWNRVSLFCTTRHGGVSKPPYDSFNLGMNTEDFPEVVAANRSLLRQSLPSDPFWLKQVHGCHVADADVEPTQNSTQFACEADASVTSVTGRVLTILTADCLPIVLADHAGTVLGVAHAGWRGLAGGVLEACLESMRLKSPQAEKWRAWIGPGIGPTAFQVGEDVREAFEGYGADRVGMFVSDPAAKGKWFANLPALARWRLQSLGVDEIEDCGLCTMTDAQRRFFSYRRDRQTGRMATVAWLT